MSNWYMVYTHAKKEYIARENIERQGLEVFLPSI